VVVSARPELGRAHVRRDVLQRKEHVEAVARLVPTQIHVPSVGMPALPWRARSRDDVGNPAHFAIIPALLLQEAWNELSDPA
jgi:hypothetical protein